MKKASSPRSRPFVSATLQACFAFHQVTPGACNGPLFPGISVSSLSNTVMIIDGPVKHLNKGVDMPHWAVITVND